MNKSISVRRAARMQQLANVVRRDTSYDDLLRFKKDGYSEARFVKNPGCRDEICGPGKECSKRDGKVWNIDELLNMDPVEHYVIFWITHPNCLCKFVPYGSRAVSQPVTTPQPTVTSQPAV